jgi:taurine dioxygenase
MSHERLIQDNPGTTYGNIRVSPLAATLAADVDAGDLRVVSDAQFAEIRRAWLAHRVIRFREQTFANADIVAFGRRFGDFQPNKQRAVPISACPGDEAPTIALARDPEYPQVSFISNLVENNTALGMLGDGELVWHTDQSSFEITPSATILYAVEAPAGEGFTEFLDMEQAYQTLPEALRLRVEGLELKHDDTYDSAGYRRPGYAQVVDVRTSPGAIHPLVVTHPETGRSALYLGRRPHAYIVGLEVAESEVLLDGLWAHAVQDRFIWRQDWRPGDLVVWDNRSLMHRRTAFDPKARRLMRRVCIKGSKPRFVPNVGGSSRASFGSK